MTKTEAITFAKKFNWTAADADRAFDSLDFKKADEQTLLLALVNFAGSAVNCYKCYVVIADKPEEQFWCLLPSLLTAF